ncbi:ADAMTS-like protein 2 [Bagarius yarrelli]|uniref:ADAMTS-like protein 2 n=1 Tax=Bagarius yarrelli TaxID=175774 RepID=A0A556U5X1_BAGYA|nr:ADAMTS-like protein 2 [Bagarius yarrelli]
MHSFWTTAFLHTLIPCLYFNTRTFDKAAAFSIKPCPNSRIGFKQHQCSQFNSKAFSKKHYEWVPLYSDDYISISSKPCDLQCTTTTGERQLLVPAHDGTFCRNGVYKGVCIEGQCQVVGCDGKLYSSKSADKCGICGGNGDTCYRISGSYRKGITQLGYAFITNIPVGATDIQIIERRKTENILALSDEAGHFFFNGNTVIDNPRNFLVAGTVFKYRRPVNLFSDGFEYIMAQGPTQQGLNVMYYNFNGKMPHITYEYTVPRLSSTPASSTQKQPLLARLMANSSFLHLSITGNEVESRVENREKEKNQTAPLDPEGNMEARGDVRWAQQALCNLSENSEVLRLKVSGEILGNELGKKDSYGSIFNLIEGDSSINDSQSMAKSVRSKLYKLQPCVESTSLPDCSTLKLNSSSSVKNSLALHIHTTSQREPEFKPETNSTSQHRAQPHPHQQGAPERLPLTDSNEFDLVSLVPDGSQAGVYRWKVSAYSPCSSTCTTGISTAYALCVRYDGSEVDESYCDTLSRPEPTYEFCTGRECPPRWETSRWSECSRTCGEGFQFRTVRCWKMIAPGFDSSVYDDLCHSAELHKPMARKSCRSKSCGPQWEVSDWSECSARCGRRGVRSREVRCSMDVRLCNESTRPINRRECDGPPCDRRWTVSDWGPCSGPCGEGRMTRYVVCKSGNGKVISDGHCDRELKPLTVQPCGAPNCPSHWVEQEWGRCNATCGRGMKSRQVVCAGLEAGVFKEFPDDVCAHLPKPEESASCFERPCSKWFTTSWSQCSKTCGSGMRVREVRCYQGEEIGHSCDSTLKPQARQSCEVQACPTEAPAEDVCEDKATANCALVLKVKLCTHWYYRKACCLSCTTKGMCTLNSVYAYPNGSVAAVCDTMIPFHPSYEPKNTLAPYRVTVDRRTYRPGDKSTISHSTPNKLTRLEVMWVAPLTVALDNVTFRY